VEHNIGDTWIDIGSPGDDIRLKYVMVCRGDARSLGQIPIQCIYQPNPNDFSTATTLNAGCMRRFSNPNVLIKCAKGSDEVVSAELVTRLFLVNAEKEAMAEGFKTC